MKPYSRLILVLALLLVGCKSQLTNDPFSWEKHSCVFTGEYDSGSSFLSIWVTNPPEYNGTFRCTNPDGSKVTCPNGQPAAKAEFSAKLQLPRDFTATNFWSLIGCNASSAPTPTPTRTALPTATTTATPPPAAASAPLLTGQVSACSLKDGFINFGLIDKDSSYSGGDVYLTINGVQVTCTRAGNNNSLLSCPLPVGVTFPAQIHAAIGDASTDDFTYDGAGCVTQTGPTTGDGSTGGAVPPEPCLGDICPPP